MESNKSQDEEIFKGKTFSGLMEDIYNNSAKKEAQINDLIKQLQPMIKNMGDATILVPIIKEYLEVAVKNDEHLIKMAAIVQRASSRNTNDTSGVLLTEEEKKQLLEAVEDVEDNR
tara:strand:+ start:724 stop:1071 length:348 start_codon:yes stop_codon:yes gene_type:complete